MTHLHAQKEMALDHSRLVNHPVLSSGRCDLAFELLKMPRPIYH